jgi:polysaccharide deacetylase 2 family uncharacterized protein YibQ
MTADDLGAPLGRQPKKRRWSRSIPLPQIVAGALALFLGAFVLWAIVGDDQFGGEPLATAPIDGHPAAAAAKAPGTPGPVDTAAANGGPDRYDGPSSQPPPALNSSPPAGTKTITIIDGKTGARQEVVIPGPASDATPADGSVNAVDARFIEMTPRGAVPKIAADGTRPAEAFAQPVQPLAGKPDAPRIAIIVYGLGVSTTGTADAIAKLPAAVTLSFMPYGMDVPSLVARARGGRHEVLLQVPMEPFDYPDNDPGPQTLLTSLAPQQNIDRLYWLMSRFQGYVGVVNMMGARFTASEPALTPVLRETAKRGLIFIDDGSNPRSVAGRIASANNLPFARADVVLDSVTTPDQIDHALGRLEVTARERGAAVGVASALPVSIDRIAKWAKGAESRGLLLVPITAVAAKEKQT